MSGKRNGLDFFN